MMAAVRRGGGAARVPGRGGSSAWRSLGLPPSPLNRQSGPRPTDPFPKPTREGIWIPTRIHPPLSKPRGVRV
jgi:hypothetical protein